MGIVFDRYKKGEVNSMDECMVIVNFSDGRASEDISIPLDISALELLIGLNEAYQLKYDRSRINEYSLRADNPICLLKGGRTLRSFGIMNGSEINVVIGEDYERTL